MEQQTTARPTEEGRFHGNGTGTQPCGQAWVYFPRTVTNAARSDRPIGRPVEVTVSRD